jgi:LacI family transcriptional regulator
MGNDKPSRADVARAAGVAESTVSRALNNSSLISEEIKERVRTVAGRLGYIPSRQAAMFARNRVGALGVVIPRYSSFPPFSRAYFPTLLDGIVIEAERHDEFITIILDKRDTTADGLGQLVIERSVDALIFAVTPANMERYGKLQEMEVPFVLVNNYHPQMNSVDALPEPGMRKAFRHAHELGHRRMGHITGDLAYKNGQDRLAAFRKLCTEFGMEPVVAEGDFSKTSGYRACGKLLSGRKPPTLIMTASDRAASGVLTYCEEHGIAVPEELSVIGYDDLHPARDSSPKLSTVQNPIEASGAEATRLILDYLDSDRATPVNRWLDTDFVARESTAPPSTE